MKTGIELIMQERVEQIEKHGKTIEQDINFNSHYQLSQAASLLGWINEEDYGYDTDSCCPSDWDKQIWAYMMQKPYEERLAIAGALYAAEIDRMQKLKQIINNHETL